MTLVSNARDWYKMISVQALIVIGSIQAVLALLPPDALSAGAFGTSVTWLEVGKWVSIAAAAVGAIGRVIDQNLGSVDPAPEPQEQKQ